MTIMLLGSIDSDVVAPLFLKLCLHFPLISNCSNDVDKM